MITYSVVFIIIIYSFFKVCENDTTYVICNSNRNYFEKYAHLFFGPNPAEEIFKFKPHKRSWILQAIKRFGDYYFRKYNNREVTQLIRQIIERYDLNKDLDMK
ncbi:MAG: hypothetical protein WCF03_13360 [Nitrososphaeraceae archaeon]